MKTVKFKNPVYLGDPRNILKIFNEKEADELILLDIMATVLGAEPNLGLLEELTSECFMPLCFGGGLHNLKQMERILKLGVEKVSVNTASVEDGSLISRAAAAFGSQSIVAAIDVKRTLVGKYEVYTHAGRTRTGKDPASHAKQMQALGAGEILLNSIDRDGSMAGYDLALIQSVTSAVHIPVIACGGAGRLNDFSDAIMLGGASACAAGSLFSFHGPHRAVLISFPKPAEVEALLQ